MFKRANDTKRIIFPYDIVYWRYTFNRFNVTTEQYSNRCGQIFITHFLSNFSISGGFILNI